MPTLPAPPVPVTEASPSKVVPRKKEERDARPPASVTDQSAAAPVAALPPELTGPTPRAQEPVPALAPEPVVQPMVWPVVAVEGRRPAASSGPAREPASSPDMTIRAVAPGARETGELAFTAKVAPLEMNPPPAAAPKADLPTTLRLSREPVLSHSQGVESEPTNSAPPQSATESKAAPTATTRGARPPVRPAPSHAHSEEPPPAPNHQAGNPASVRFTAQTPAPAGAASAGAKASTIPEASPRAAFEGEPAAVKQAGPAREIRLELGNDGDRVEVKLSERAGELKVSVRTPDSHLAERLRADLPALSARLEESGLRAETWRPSAAAGNETRTTHEVSTAGSGDQPRDPESGRQEREQQRQRETQQPRVTEENETSTEKGKDFEWFLSPQ